MRAKRTKKEIHEGYSLRAKKKKKKSGQRTHYGPLPFPPPPENRAPTPPPLPADLPAHSDRGSSIPSSPFRDWVASPTPATENRRRGRNGSPSSPTGRRSPSGRGRGRSRRPGSGSSSSDFFGFSQREGNRLTKINKPIDFRDDEAKVSLSQVRFKRRENFRIDERLFSLKIEKLPTDPSRLLLTFLTSLRSSIIKAIFALQELYPKEEMRFVQGTLIADKMKGGARSGIYLLHEPPQEIASNLVNLLYHFLQSHMDLPLGEEGQGLHVLFEIYSSSSRSIRRKLSSLQTGCTRNGTFKTLDPKYEFNPNCEGHAFLQDRCLLIALAVAIQHLKSFGKKKSPVRDMFKCPKLSEKQFSKLHLWTKQLLRSTKSPSIVGPVSFSKIEKIVNENNLQLFVYSDHIQLKLAFKMPERNDALLKPVHLLLRTRKNNDKEYFHVTYIFNLRRFYSHVHCICPFCFKPLTYRSFKESHKACNTRCFSCRRISSREEFQTYPDTVLPYRCHFPVLDPKKLKNCADQSKTGQISVTCEFCGLSIRSKTCFKLHRFHCKKEKKLKRDICRYCFEEKEGSLGHVCKFPKSIIAKNYFNLATAALILKDFGKEVLLVNLIYEYKQKGTFVSKTFLHESLTEKHEEVKLQENYFPKNFSKELWESRPRRKQNPYLQSTLSDFVEKKTLCLEDRFLQFIVSMNLRNYVFILNSQEALAAILNSLQLNKFDPKCISRNNHLLRVTWKCQNICFVCASVFELPETNVLFPKRLLSRQNFGKVFRNLKKADFVPPWTTVTCLQEKEIDEICRKLFNFNASVINYGSKINYFLFESATRFLAMAFDTQTFFFERIKCHESSYLDPLSYFSVNSYNFDVMKRFCFDKYSLYPLIHPDGVKGNHSLQESKFIALRKMMSPFKQVKSFYTTGNLKTFKATCPDYYIELADGTTVNYILGFVHGQFWHNVARPELLKKSAANVGVIVTGNQVSFSNFSLSESWKKFGGDFLEQADTILKMNPSVSKIEVIFESHLKKVLQNPHVASLLENKLNCVTSNRLVPRNSLKFPRRECLDIYFDSASQPGNSFFSLDINCAFLSAAIDLECPIGQYETLLECDFNQSQFSFIDDKLHFDNCEILGLAKVLVLPTIKEAYPLLTVPIGGSEIPFACHACALAKSTNECSHSPNLRSAELEIPIIMVNYLQKSGNYKIMKVLQITFCKEKAKLFKPYLLPLASLILRSRGFPSSFSELQKMQYCSKINEEMSFPDNLKLSISNVKKDLLLSTFLKKSFTTSFGKLSQKAQPNHFFARSHLEMEHILTKHKLTNFRVLSDSICKVEVERIRKLPYRRENQNAIHAYVLSTFNYNMWRYVKQLESAHFTVHMINYDCLYLSGPTNSISQLPLKISPAIGHFKIEQSNIEQFIAFSPSKFMTQRGNECTFTLCGISLKTFPQNKMSKEEFLYLFEMALEKEEASLCLKHYKKSPFSYGNTRELQQQQWTMTNRFCDNRKRLNSIKMLPYGF